MRWTITSIVAALLGLTSNFARAEEVLKELTWEKAPEHAELVVAEGAGADAKPSVLKITGKKGGVTVKVMTLKDPPVTADRYAIIGQVKYADAKGTGYLEMWSMFPDGGAFFSKTLAPSGPMGAITGTSDWRKFSLPFNSKPKYIPNELVMNVVLPEEGTVWLKDLKLVEYAPTTAPAAKSGAGALPWWGNRQGGIIGALAGIILGTLGALHGVFVSRGRAKDAVIALTTFVMIAAMVTLGIGLVAVVQGQPYAVYYPLLLAGGLGVLLTGLMLRLMKRRYAEVEMRRISAMDVA